MLPWLLWAAPVPRSHENYMTHLRPAAILANLDRVPTIVGAFAVEAGNVWRYGLLFPALAGAAILGRGALRERRMRLVWSLLLLHLLAYGLVFMVTAWTLSKEYVRVHVRPPIRTSKSNSSLSFRISLTVPRVLAPLRNSTRSSARAAHGSNPQSSTTIRNAGKTTSVFRP